MPTTPNERLEPATHSHTITWKEPYLDAKEIGKMSGLAYLQSLIDTNRPPPIFVLMNMQLSSIERGKVVFEGIPSDFHYNPLGMVHGGFAATLLDSALGCAVHTMLEPGFVYTTIELKVNYVRALRTATGVVRCEGTVIHVGGRIATAQAYVKDANGKLYAHATTTCLIMALQDAAG